MVQFEANACPDRSRIGMARAESPLLDKPLEGPVYLRSSKHRLPDILVDLHGQFHIELDGRVDSVKQRLRTTFTTLPDVPVSRFMLRLQGGGKGLLENSDGVCSRSHKASVKMNAQNGLSRRLHVRVKAPCGAARHHKGHKRPGNRGTRAGG
jgi:hypothetical protein